MISPTFHSYTYRELEDLLPMQERIDIQSEGTDQEIKLRNLSNLKSMRLTKNWFPIPTAIGVAMTVGGVFLVLAAYQILPRGVNAITQLNPYGKIGGYSLIGVGSLLTLVGGSTSCFAYMRNSKIHWIEKKVMVLLEARERAEVDSLFPKLLQPNEYLIIDDPSRSLLKIYQCTAYPTKGKKSGPSNPKKSYVTLSSVSYAKSSQEKALNVWLQARPLAPVTATSVSLKTLRKRVKGNKALNTKGA